MNKDINSIDEAYLQMIKYICRAEPNKLSCLCGADEQIGKSLNLEGLVKLLEATKDIEGDYIETGAWRGGSCMLAKYFYDYNQINKKVYVADSFKGLPPPQPEKYPVDIGDIHHTIPSLSVSRKTVEDNFRKANLLDENVIFVEGWFEESLPPLRKRLDKISLLRLDGDMYDATWNSLINLYDKLSVGGIIVIDDYSTHPRCRMAVHDFRKKYVITEEIRDPNYHDDSLELGGRSGPVAWWTKEK
jgi:hypothetical protein